MATDPNLPQLTSILLARMEIVGTDRLHFCGERHGMAQFCLYIASVLMQAKESEKPSLFLCRNSFS